MRRTITALLIALTVSLGTVGTATAAPGPGTQCTEDMACWNCRTMGNRICGSDRYVEIVVNRGEPRRVTPQRAAYLFGTVDRTEVCIIKIVRRFGYVQIFDNDFCRR
jgi:hypothetical protein